jgi:hypothetical protein
MSRAPDASGLALTAAGLAIAGAGLLIAGTEAADAQVQIGLSPALMYGCNQAAISNSATSTALMVAGSGTLGNGAKPQIYLCGFNFMPASSSSSFSVYSAQSGSTCTSSTVSVLPTVDLTRGVQHVMVVVPENSHVDEAQHVGRKHWRAFRHRGEIGTVRDLHLQHHDGVMMAMTPSLKASSRPLPICYGFCCAPALSRAPAALPGISLDSVRPWPPRQSLNRGAPVPSATSRIAETGVVPSVNSRDV